MAGMAQLSWSSKWLKAGRVWYKGWITLRKIGYGILIPMYFKWATGFEIPRQKTKSTRKFQYSRSVNPMAGFSFDGKIPTHHFPSGKNQPELFPRRKCKLRWRRCQVDFQYTNGSLILTIWYAANLRKYVNKRKWSSDSGKFLAAKSCDKSRVKSCNQFSEV